MNNKVSLRQIGQVQLPVWQLVLLIVVIGICASMVLLLTIKIIGEKEPPPVVPPIDTNQNIDENNPDENVFVTPLPPECGNSVCEENETIYNCLADCFECNENATCEPAIGENSEMCPIDCTTPDTNTTTTGCGNLLCEFPENPNTCFTDCGICDNDDLCETQQGENENTCTNDCQAACQNPPCAICGNQVCETPENPFTCSVDCGCNNNDICEQNRGENEDTCENDCEINLQCTDNDNDLFFAQANCGTALDCNDNNNQVKPNTGEICADHVDNNCNGVTDEANSQQPTCPCVTFDAQKNIVVNGQKTFPIGFWSFYYELPNSTWQDYASNFNFIVDGPINPLRAVLESNNIKRFAQVNGDGTSVSQNYSDPGILAWEVLHEADITTQAGINAVQSGANAIRNADVCKRPVFVTPEGGAIDIIPAIQQYVDIVAIQSGYILPENLIRYSGERMSVGVQGAGQKTAIWVANVTGYQPSRFRAYTREQTPQELRVQAYDAILAGAKGVALWSFQKGSGDWGEHGFTELFDSYYNVLDPYSSGQYAGIKNLGRDIKNHSNIFLSPFSSSLTINTNSNDIRCKAWDVNIGTGIQKTMICVNIGQDHPSYFDFGGGDVVYRVKAQTHTSDGVWLPTEFAPIPPYPFSTKEMNPNLVYLQDIYPGFANQNKTLDKINIYFDGTPSGATFTYAIYADNSRDDIPDTQVYVSSPTAVPTTPGTYEFALPNVIIEHTKKYHLLLKANSSGIMIQEQDARGGARIKDTDYSNIYYDQFAGPIPLDQTYPEAHIGKTVSASILVNGLSSNSYCVEKDTSQNCTNGTLLGVNNLVNDTFAPYAVHIYKFGVQ